MLLLLPLRLLLVVVLRRDLLAPVGRVADEAAAARREESGLGRERGRRLLQLLVRPAAAATDGHLGWQRGESFKKYFNLMYMYSKGSTK